MAELEVETIQIEGQIDVVGSDRLIDPVKFGDIVDATDRTGHSQARGANFAVGIAGAQAAGLEFDIAIIEIDPTPEGEAVAVDWIRPGRHAVKLPAARVLGGSCCGGDEGSAGSQEGARKKTLGHGGGPGSSGRRSD